MFLEDRDYKVVCNDDTLDIITQSDEQTRRDAERSAQEEVEGYLRARYDTAKAFAQTGDKRNAMLVRVTVSIALFYLGQSLPQFMGNEQRRDHVQQCDCMAQRRTERQGHAGPAAV